MRILFFAVIFIMYLGNSLQAQIIWDFGTTTVSGAAANVPANITVATDIAQVNNSGTTTFLATPAVTPVSSGYTGASGAFSGNANAKVGAYTTSSTYLQVVLTPAANHWVNITAINWGNLSLATTGPTYFSIYTSVDNYAAPIGTARVVPSGGGSTGGDPTWALVNPTITPVIGVMGTAVTIRIFAFDGAGTQPSSGSINWRIDDLRITATAQSGTVGQIPKYSSASTFTNSVIAENNTDIGIGTASPAQKLDVAGGIRFTGALLAGSTPTAGTDGQFLKSTGPTTPPVWSTVAGGTSGWGLTGNASTVAGTNFIGTTDGSDVIFKRDGVFSGILSTWNTAFGVGALKVVEETGNTALGNNALANATESNGNTATGSYSLATFIGGEYNTAIGRASLYNTIGGNYNTVAGAFSLYALSGGTRNTTIGAWALPSLTGGNGNIAIGDHAGKGVENGSNNVFIGGAWNAADLPQDLSSNIIIADGAGNRRINVNDLGNVGIGTITPAQKLDIAGGIKFTGALLAGPTPTGGTDGQFLKSTGPTTPPVWSTISAGTSGWGLTGNAGTVAGTNFIGTTDDNDVVFKRNDVLSGKLGSQSTSFGVGALSLGMGSFNVAVGVDALRNDIEGYSNTAIGAKSLFNSNEAEYNTAVGSSALYNSIYGSRNTAVGVSSLFSLNTGVSNTTIGVSSLRTLVNGNGNIAIGEGAGRGVIKGDNNVFIGGTDATDLPQSLSNNIIIADGEGNRRININDTGNVGIGTITPTEKLDVNGNLHTTGKILIGQANNNAAAPYALAVNGWAIFTRATVKSNTNWPDYVFEPTYKLPTLVELEAYLAKHKHLPDVPSAAEVKEKGIDLGDNQSILLKKVEELTLYMIALNKKVEALAKENAELKLKASQQ